MLSLARCREDHCITCADDGEVMGAQAVDESRQLARCAGAGGIITVDIALVSPVAVGDQLLVHAGTAIARLQGSA
jgi:hydrogenase maturation factor